MRKLSFTMCLLIAMVFGYGQKKELNNAYNFYLNGYLDKAKESIDRAILNDETVKDAKTWMYRGNIYLRIAEIREKEAQWERDKEDSIKKGKPEPVKSREQQSQSAYLTLCTNCADVAYEAFVKAFELDRELTVNMAVPTYNKGLELCGAYLYNESIRYFEKGKYEEAHEVLIKANKADDKQDNITFLLAYTAELTNKKDAAKTHYNSMIRRRTPSKDARVYQQLANIYKSEDDTARMLKTMQDAEPIFITDTTVNKDFALAYSFFLSWAGKSDDATDVINKALEKYPDDHTLLVSYGTSLSEDGQYAKAEMYLTKALELKPDDHMAMFNLGTCYYNNSVSSKRAAGIANDDNDYKRLTEEADKLMGQARLCMEKALELLPSDRNTMLSLKRIYLQLGLTDEHNAIDEKLNALDK